ncbi:hypothetical protein JOL62DRAFT_286418 [Phyllosticta paracitricarpa]|uniref:Uncharacterized protein n=1 Tax=Phyllosticta paracitricarpa TaxID=2016321 RepID=A0ABR1MW02_9PEZI
MGWESNPAARVHRPDAAKRLLSPHVRTMTPIQAERNYAQSPCKQRASRNLSRSSSASPTPSVRGAQKLHAPTPPAFEWTKLPYLDQLLLRPMATASARTVELSVPVGDSVASDMIVLASTIAVHGRVVPRKHLPDGASGTVDRIDIKPARPFTSAPAHHGRGWVARAWQPRCLRRFCTFSSKATFVASFLESEDCAGLDRRL